MGTSSVDNPTGPNDLNPHNSRMDNYRWLLDSNGQPIYVPPVTHGTCSNGSKTYKRQATIFKSGTFAEYEEFKWTVKIVRKVLDRDGEQSKTTRVWGSVWCYHPVWSGIGITKTETKGRSRRGSYATPHELITSYRLPYKGSFMSHFVSVCDDPFPALTFYWHALWLLWHHTIPPQHKQFNAPSYNGWWEGDRMGWDSWKGHWLIS